MANKFNFRTTLTLNTKEFRKGVAEVKKSLSSIKNSFLNVAGALGAGLGFGKMISSIKDTSVQLDSARNVLKNVSKEVGEYGKNLTWLKKISNEYGQEINTLTLGFAQFRAAADSSNLSVEQMRDIFQALTKAAGAYHLSADQTKDMVNAVTQMMSKGKVAAEELRRQLGNNLPGAFNLMAQAAYQAGITTSDSTAELESMMKQGRVMAEDVLPAFAKILNQVTQGANFDSLQGSINRLKNSWVDLVEKSNFSNFYKGLVDGASGALRYITKNFLDLKTTVYGIFAGIGTLFGFKSATKGMEAFKDYVAQANKEIDAASQKITALGQKLQNFNNAYVSKGTGGSYGVNTGATSQSTPKDILNGIGGDTKQLQAAINYNKALLEQDAAIRKVNSSLGLSNKQIRLIQNNTNDLKNLMNTLNGTTSGFIGSFTNGLTKVGSYLKYVGKQFVAAFQANAIMLAVSAIVGVMTKIVTQAREARKEAERIANIPKEMKFDVEKIETSVDSQLTTLTAMKKVLQQSSSLKGKEELIKGINRELGRTGDNAFTVKSNIDDIVEAIDNWIEGLRKVALQQALIAKVSEATSKIINLQSENDAIKKDPKYNETKTTRVPVSKGVGPSGVVEATELTKAAKKLHKKVEDNEKELKATNEGIDNLLAYNPELAIQFGIENEADWNKLMAELFGNKKSDSTTTSTSTTTTTGGGGTPNSTMQNYLDETKKLKNQYDNGAISADEYQKKLAELTKTTYETLAAFGILEEVIKKLPAKFRDAANNLKGDVIANEISDSIDEAIKADDDKWAKELDAELEKDENALKNYLEATSKAAPVEQQRNSRFDYKYSSTPKKGLTYSELDKKKMEDTIELKLDYTDSLKDTISELKEKLANGDYGGFTDEIVDIIAKLQEKLKDAQGDAQTLQDKLNFAEAEENLQEYMEELKNAKMDSITTLASSMDRVVDGIQSIAEVFDEDVKDSKLFQATEAFFTVLNGGIQIIEAVTAVVKAMQTAEEIEAKIKEASATKTATANAAVVLSEEEKAAAEGGAAVAGAASSTAAIPVVGPALAVAAVATILAAVMAGMSKFATGGIVGGNSYSGDKNVARVNSGEMILNKAQQGTLWQMLNGKGGMGGSVDFKIKGSDLVGAISNYNNKKKG